MSQHPSETPGPSSDPGSDPTTGQPSGSYEVDGGAGPGETSNPYSSDSGSSAASGQPGGPLPNPSHGDADQSSGYGSRPTPQPPYDVSQGDNQGGYGQPGYPQPGHHPSQQAYGAQPGYPPPYAQQGHPQQPYPGQPGVQPPVSVSDEKTWGIISHISVPFVGFIGPLIVYLVYKDRSRFLKDTSTEALNFSILYSLVLVVSVILFTVGIGVILYSVAAIGALVLCIMATLAASRHEFYTYPVNWRLIS